MCLFEGRPNKKRIGGRKTGFRRIDTEKQEKVYGVSKTVEAETIEEQKELEELDGQAAEQPKIRRPPEELTKVERERHKALHTGCRDF